MKNSSNTIIIIFFSGRQPYTQPPKEIIAFNEKIDEFKALDCEVVACSVDSQFTHLSWIERGKQNKIFQEMKIVLLSDANHNISKTFRVYKSQWGHTVR